MRSKFTRAHQVDILPNATVPTGRCAGIIVIFGAYYPLRHRSLRVLVVVELAAQMMVSQRQNMSLPGG